MSNLLAPHHLDAWIRAQPPKRRAYLEQARQLLLEPSGPTPDMASAMKPFMTLLQKAGGKGIRVDKHGYSPHGTSLALNRRFGFRTEGLPADAFLEAEALLMVGYAAEVIRSENGRARLTEYGRMLMKDPPALWSLAYRVLPIIRPGGPTGEMWLTLLAWLVAGSPEGLGQAVEEAMGEEPDEERLRIGFYSLYTYLRALGMFVDRPDTDQGPPRLSPSGRAGTIKMLRMLAAGHAMGAHDPILN